MVFAELERVILQLAGRRGVRAALQAASQLLRTTAASDWLAEVLSGTELESLLRAIVSVDHVGFLASTDTVTVGELARANGFEGPQHAFASTIIARELGALEGVDNVPTTVLKASSAAGPNGRSHFVEIFMPERVSAETIRAWGERVPPHIAFALEKGAQLSSVTHALGRAGFHRPSYMRDGPLTNPAERTTALYFDGMLHERPMRFEFLEYNA